MYVRISLDEVTAHEVTRRDPPDNVYFSILNISSFTSQKTRVVDFYKGDVKRNFSLYDGFVANNSRAIFVIQIMEYDFWSSDDLIGDFIVEVRVDNNKLSAKWRHGTSVITGPQKNLRTEIRASEDESLYTIKASVMPSPLVVKITNKKSKKCLDVVSEKIGKANVQQYTCKNTETQFVGNQRWFIRRSSINRAHQPGLYSVGEGDDRLTVTGKLFNIFADHSNDCLDIETGFHGNNIQQYPFHGKSNQQWLILPSNEDGFYYILSTDVKRAFDIEGGSTESQANVILSNFNGNDSQKWKIEPTPPLSNSRRFPYS